MKKTAFLSILLFFLGSFLYAKENIREPFDKISYAWSEIQINKLIETINRSNIKVNKIQGMPVAAIYPHDDHLYSGFTLNGTISQIKGKKKAIIFGVLHRTARKKAGEAKNCLIFDNFVQWKAPIRNVKVDKKFRKFLINGLNEKNCIVSNIFHSYEHSVEAVLPFLVKYNPDIEIVPVMVSPMDLHTTEKISEKLSALIVNYLNKNKINLNEVIFLISADANHYGQDFKNTKFGTGEKGHKKARENDLRIYQKYFKGEITEKRIKKLIENKEFVKALWCGRYDIPLGLLTVEKVVKQMTDNQVFGQLIRYDDTYQDPMVPLKGYGFGISAPFSLNHWVGHMGVVFTLK